MKAQASAKAVRISPRKAGEVAALIRGRTVTDALVILDHTPRKAAGMISKLLNSASANAENNHDMKREELLIETLQVTRAPSPKRGRPAAHGRSLPYRLHHSHLSVTVTNQQVESTKTEVKKPASSDKPKPVAKKSVAKKTTASPAKATNKNSAAKKEGAK